MSSQRITQEIALENPDSIPNYHHAIYDILENAYPRYNIEFLRKFKNRIDWKWISNCVYITQEIFDTFDEFPWQPNHIKFRYLPIYIELLLKYPKKNWNFEKILEIFPIKFVHTYWEEFPWPRTVHEYGYFNPYYGELRKRYAGRRDVRIMDLLASEPGVWLGTVEFWEIASNFIAMEDIEKFGNMFMYDHGILARRPDLTNAVASQQLNRVTMYMWCNPINVKLPHIKETLMKEFIQQDTCEYNLYEKFLKYLDNQTIEELLSRHKDMVINYFYNNNYKNRSETRNFLIRIIRHLPFEYIKDNKDKFISISIMNLFANPNVPVAWIIQNCAGKIEPNDVKCLSYRWNLTANDIKTVASVEICDVSNIKPNHKYENALSKIIFIRQRVHQFKLFPNRWYLTKLSKTEAFVRWWYSPENPGGRIAKDSMFRMFSSERK
jgi:hypothetical protein